jgi:hypothetical protein
MFTYFSIESSNNDSINLNKNQRSEKVLELLHLKKYKKKFSIKKKLLLKNNEKKNGVLSISFSNILTNILKNLKKQSELNDNKYKIKLYDGSKINEELPLDNIFNYLFLDYLYFISTKGTMYIKKEWKQRSFDLRTIIYDSIKESLNTFKHYKCYHSIQLYIRISEKWLNTELLYELLLKSSDISDINLKNIYENKVNSLINYIKKSHNGIEFNMSNIIKTLFRCILNDITNYSDNNINVLLVPCI